MKKILLFILFLFFLWLGGLVVFNYKINHIRPNTEEKAEAIVVLTGGRHRLTEAVKLLNEGASDKLFISGVQDKTSLKDLEKRNKIKFKDNREIILDKIATNTFENARETSIWLKNKNIKSILLVTSNYHIFRSLVEFRRWSRDIKILLHPVYSEKISPLWWKSLDNFYFLAGEYNKFIFAWLRASFCYFKEL
ncbi:MAG: YdcF family protein [Alphaproteobacteria bacterium]|nr:YdcF family protein [Alphaproteobacteria bacterium]